MSSILFAMESPIPRQVYVGAWIGHWLAIGVRGIFAFENFVLRKLCAIRCPADVYVVGAARASTLNHV